MPFGEGLRVLVHGASEHAESINFYLSISINRTTLPVWFEPSRSSYRLRYGTFLFRSSYMYSITSVSGRGWRITVSVLIEGSARKAPLEYWPNIRARRKAFSCPPSLD